MQIRELIQNGGNAVLMVTALDLQEFGRSLIEDYKASCKHGDNQYYTREEFAQRKGVTLGTLWRWERAGILKGTRRGSRVFYRDEDLIEK
jgi:hypothetical protein